jgi:hypothetical protein
MNYYAKDIPPLIWVILLIGLVFLFSQLMSSTSGTFEERSARVSGRVEMIDSR